MKKRSFRDIGRAGARAIVLAALAVFPTASTATPQIPLPPPTIEGFDDPSFLIVEGSVGLIDDAELISATPQPLPQPIPELEGSVGLVDEGELISATPIQLPRVAQFVRGNADGKGGVDVTDALTILTTLFIDGTPLPCGDAADVDDSGELNMGDAIFLLQFLFVGGVDVSPPYPSCGVDPTEDSLDCMSSPQCP